MKTACVPVVCVWLAGVVCGAAGQMVERLDGSTISGPEIDAAVARLMKAGEVTGVGITLLNGGKVAYSKAYGYRDLARKLPLTVDSVMAGASFTKVAFAYCVMQLVDEGVLDLDKPVAGYLARPLPEYAGYRDLAGDERYRKITARMLLSHTSGFPNFRWLNDDHKLNINFEPGSRYAYSGEGIELLQLVVETVARQGLAELMQKRVFDRLGMTRTSMVSEDRLAGDYASGYDEWGRPLGHEQRNRADAAGSMQTTLNDFTLFVKAVMEGKGLSHQSWRAMLSPQIRIHSKRQFPTLGSETTDANDGIGLSYGLGWGLYRSPYGQAFFKEGHSDGFRNYTVVFEGPRDGIVIMTNSANGEGIFKPLLETLQRNTFTPIEWEGYTPYNELPARPALAKHTEVKVSAAALERVAGRYALGDNLLITVTRTGDHLSLRENDEGPGELFPEGELRYFSKTADDVVTFNVDAAGRVSELVVHTGGREIAVKRVK